jgi:release factor glutamine methyltransferase
VSSLSAADLVTALREAGCVYAEEEAAVLLEAAAQGRDLPSMLARRVAGEPLEWVAEWAEFREEDGDGVRVVVRPGVFVPRARTIELALAASEFLGPDGLLIDLCCGSGAISAFLLHRLPGLRVYASDIDPVATACARENLPSASVLTGDLFEPLPAGLRRNIDVIVANTPYVPTEVVPLMPPEARDHEPLHTLDGGPDGLRLLRRIRADAGQWLRPGGVLLIEINETQYDAARTAFEEAGLDTTARIDPDGTTVIIGRAPATD